MRGDIPVDISRLRGQLTDLTRRLRREARNDPESWTRMLIVSAIDRLGGNATPSAIGRAEAMRSSQMAAVLRDLDASGLIERLPDAADRRITRLRLSPLGTAILAESRRRRDAWLARVMKDHLSGAERQVVMEAGELIGRILLKERGPEQ